MTNLRQIEGIGPAYADKLQQTGITSIEDLLDKGAAPRGRKAIAEETDINGTPARNHILSGRAN
jgi:predicted flap endonuclease-1-like 5' DNA nuclease